MTGGCDGDIETFLRPWPARGCGFCRIFRLRCNIRHSRSRIAFCWITILHCGPSVGTGRGRTEVSLPGKGKNGRVMREDICFGEVDLATAAALEDWNAMILGFLSHGTATPVRLAAVLEREPGFAMGHAARGLFSLLMGRRELVETARAARVAAEAALVQGAARKACDRMVRSACRVAGPWPVQGGGRAGRGDRARPARHAVRQALPRDPLHPGRHRRDAPVAGAGARRS